MFESKVYVMDKFEQSGPAGKVVSWLAGQEIDLKYQISNMLNVQIAAAQGVRPTGYATPTKQMVKDYKIGLDTYFMVGTKRSATDYTAEFFMRVADVGIIEAGEGIFNERQYALEVVNSLPR